MHFALIHDVRAEARRFSAKGARVDIAGGGAQLGVPHVMVDELESVESAQFDLRWQRVALVRLPRIEPPTEITHGGADCERCAKLSFPLCAQVDCARALDFRSDAGALPGAIDAQLDHLVVHAGRQTLRERHCIRSGKNDVARQDYSDDVVIVVGHLLVTDVQNVERKSRRAEARG